MQSLKPALTFSAKKLSKSVGIYTAVIGIFFYHVVFEKDFECTCEDQTSDCWSYMILPAFIIFFMVLWLDGSFQAFVKYTCLKGVWKFCWFSLLWICKAVFISLLWPMSVLIDGDWFICCHHEGKLYCRNQTFDEEKIIKKLKITSRIKGFGALLGIIVVAAIWRCVPWRKFCTRDSDKSQRLSKDDLFKKIVLEEGEHFMTSKLIEVAKGKIEQKIDSFVTAKQWGKCYDVVEEVFEDLSQHEPPPGGSPSAGERGNGSGEEMQPMVQPPPDELQPVSSSNEDTTSL